MKLNFLTVCITLFFVASCTKKELPAKEDTPDTPPLATIVVSSPVAVQVAEKNAYNKMVGSNLRFIASLEKEVLKLILESKAPDVNQFEVLAYGFDRFNGVKTGFLQGFGCQKIGVRSENLKYEFFSECTKPSKKLAELNIDPLLKDKIHVQFLTANWKVILGNASGINPDRHCEILLLQKKVQGFDCTDTVFSPTSNGGDINLFEIKIKKYAFNRNQKDELVVEGGQYKDLIETKKISILVPISGRISIIEKELKVKDDFADLQNKLLGLEQEKKDEKENEKKDESKEENKNEGETDNKKENSQGEEQGQAESKTESVEKTEIASGTPTTGEPEYIEQNPEDPNGTQSVPSSPPVEVHGR